MSSFISHGQRCEQHFPVAASEMRFRGEFLDPISAQKIFLMKPVQIVFENMQKKIQEDKPKTVELQMSVQRLSYCNFRRA